MSTSSCPSGPKIVEQLVRPWGFDGLDQCVHRVFRRRERSMERRWRRARAGDERGKQRARACDPCHGHARADDVSDLPPTSAGAAPAALPARAGGAFGPPVRISGECIGAGAASFSGRLGLIAAVAAGLLARAVVCAVVPRLAVLAPRYAAARAAPALPAGSPAARCAARCCVRRDRRARQPGLRAVRLAPRSDLPGCPASLRAHPRGASYQSSHASLYM